MTLPDSLARSCNWLSIATNDEEREIMRPLITVNRFCPFFSLLLRFLAPKRAIRSGIDGLVTRDIAAGVSGATIGIDNQTGGFHRRTTTTASGYYLMDDLEPGGYSVWQK